MIPADVRAQIDRLVDQLTDPRKVETRRDEVHKALRLLYGVGYADAACASPEERRVFLRGWFT